MKHGAPPTSASGGVDGVTFQAIEAEGPEKFLVQLREGWCNADIDLGACGR